MAQGKRGTGETPRLRLADGWTRKTFIVNEGLMEKFERVAFHLRVSQKDLMAIAMRERERLYPAESSTPIPPKADRLRPL
jgi:hypothetical protein